MTDQLIEYIAGTDNILLTVSHGGDLIPPRAPLRKKGITVKDDNLIETGLYIHSYLKKQGIDPHLVINHLSRKVCDTNRSIYKCATTKYGKDHHSDFHHQVKAIIEQIKSGHKEVFLLDLHGQSSIDAIEIGYGVRKLNLRKLLSGKTIKRKYPKVSSRKMKQIIFGDHSVANIFIGNGLNAVPNKDYIPDKRYRRGGYTVEHYAKDPWVIPIQFELSKKARIHLPKVSKSIHEIILDLKERI